MKKYIVVVALVLVQFGAFSQKGQWEGLKNMKMLMKQTFPPIMKNNDVSAARKNASELYTLAKKMENGDKPRVFRKKKMAVKFDTITANAKALKDQVAANAADDEIKNTMVVFHASFAEIAHHKKAGKGHGHGEI